MLILAEAEAFKNKRDVSIATSRDANQWLRPVGPKAASPASRARQLSIAFGIMLTLAATACSNIHRSGAMAALHDDAPCASRPETVLILLPGSYSSPVAYVEKGFVRAVRDRHLAVDIVLPDASVGYYADRTILDHLQADIVEPAKLRGYRRIVMAGISIGAFGALIHAESHRGEDAAVIAIAPYLGTMMSTHLVEAAGGLRLWRAPTDDLALGDDDRLWRWLQQQASHLSGPPLYLAFGLDDRFERSDRLLAAALPEERVFTAPGDHDWPTWRPLWDRLLDAGALGVRTCETASP